MMTKDETFNDWENLSPLMSTVETRIKEPAFIRTLRLKFNILNPLNKNISEADTGGRSYIKGFMSSEFTRTLKNSQHSDQNPSVVQKTIRFLTMTLK